MGPKPKRRVEVGGTENGHQNLQLQILNALCASAEAFQKKM